MKIDTLIDELESMKKLIDEMNYEQLLGKWMHAPLGDPFFQGEVGKYYREVMKRKREEVGNAAHITASKRIG